MKEFKKIEYTQFKYTTDRTIGWEIKEVDSIQEVLIRKEKGFEKFLYVEKLNIEDIKSTLLLDIIKLIEFHKKNNLTYDFFYFQSALIDKASVLLTQEIVRLINTTTTITKFDKITYDFVKPSNEEVFELCLHVYKMLLLNSEFALYYNTKQFKNNTNTQDKVKQILDKKDLNIQIKITDKSLSELLESNEELQDKIIEIFNKNKDRI